ncbi:MAG: hypothetical protein BGO43_15030 [Gammaproteobacteria bacterium 39-13]|nr:anhydro-N-acetylmuramic acid kinase [Gammaproteobacteria bacterium]OJV86252.1 MAG: hypothetical protein BGO43_15030 [Gammaproteobacteria bacterium 39-13]
MLSIGLMSGTSMDGIDAALLETDGTAKTLKALGHSALAYTSEFKILLKAAEYAVRKCNGLLEATRASYLQAIQDYLKNELHFQENQIESKINELAIYLYGDTSKLPAFDEVILRSTQLHETVVRKLLAETGYRAQEIDVIGYHGQTLFHRPSEKISIVVGNGQQLADALGITVVNDFRRRDVASGGQGAPFAPIYHQALAIRDNKIPVAVVNCGGISNITLINSANELDLIGFDTGPGNGLIDRLMRRRTQGKENMDKDGKYGRKGKVNSHVLEALYEKSIIKDGKNYFSTKPPKSLDYGDMILIPELDALSLEDACATLEAFTADSIITSLQLLDSEAPLHWILSGGGWNNTMIRYEFDKRLRQKMPHVTIQTANEALWDSQALEAQIFAFLAVRSLQNKALSVPGTTWVPRPLSGGHAFIPRSGMTENVKKLIQANPSVLNGYQEAS